jgi:hypothetical protein
MFKPIKDVARKYGPSPNSPSFIDLMYAAEEIKAPSALETAYLNQKDLNQCLVTFNPEDNKLYLGCEVLDTQNYTSKNGRHKAAYAVDKLGRLYIAEHRSPINTPSNHAPGTPSSPKLPAFQERTGEKFFYHSSFFRAKPGICFGMLEAIDGKITYLDNHSGHYKPSEQDLLNAQERLAYALSDDCVIQVMSEDSENGGDNDNLNALFGADY